LAVFPLLSRQRVFPNVSVRPVIVDPSLDVQR
jgi:hypothetical protein